jgi:hypothetical protein
MDPFGAATGARGGLTANPTAKASAAKVDSFQARFEAQLEDSMSRYTRENTKRFRVVHLGVALAWRKEGDTAAPRVSPIQPS